MLCKREALGRPSRFALYLLSTVLRMNDVLPISQTGKLRFRKAKCFSQDDGRRESVAGVCNSNFGAGREGKGVEKRHPWRAREAGGTQGAERWGWCNPAPQRIRRRVISSGLHHPGRS